MFATPILWHKPTNIKNKKYEISVGDIIIYINMVPIAPWNGDFSLISIKWNEKASRLIINPLLNAKTQKFNIIIKSEHGHEINDSVSFEGKKLTYIRKY
jgi:hypothetical protein